jgi:hypothetical protein
MRTLLVLIFLAPSVFAESLTKLTQAKIVIHDCQRNGADESAIIGGRQYCDEKLKCNESVGDGNLQADERQPCLRKGDGSCPSPMECMKDVSVSDDDLDAFLNKRQINYNPNEQRPVVQ